MPEQYLFNGVTFSLASAFPAKSGTGSTLNGFFPSTPTGATYYFITTSYNEIGFSGQSNMISVYIDGFEEPYSLMPSGLTASSSPLGATLFWYDNSQTETGFKIFYNIKF